MIAIKNIEPKEMVVSYEGTDYIFPNEKVVLVEDKVYDFIKESYPLTFKFKVKLSKKKPVPKVSTKKTQVFSIASNRVSDMNVTLNGQQANTFANPETEGPEYYGKGIEIENI